MGLDASTTALNLRRRYIEGLLTRAVGALAFASFMAGAAFFRIGLDWSQVTPVVVILSSMALVNVPYWFLGRRTGFSLSYFYLHWALDLVAITACIYFLGGIDVPLVQFTYMTIILTAAIFVSQRASFHLATGATIAYGFLGVAEVQGWLPVRSGIWHHHYAPTLRVFIVGISGLTFFVFAYLAGTLSELLRRANEELATTKGIVEEQNRLLEQRVRERTRELESRTLELQERTAELEELVHIVTHDLQNVAVASTETTRKLVELDGANFSARGQRYVERLQRDCRLMATMLRNLLEVVTQSEVAERRELVNVAGVVSEAAGRAHGVVERKGIDVRIGDLPPLLAEEQKIYHVFENLLTNACKYVGDKPNPVIEVGGFVGDDSIEYYVRDNGVGIDPTQMGRIFQLYHRAPNQTVAGVVQQGHGIGLAVVKRIVQRYGGRIWVESVLGEGSTFRLSFPREVRELVEEVRDSA
jgi:signal transduction histidine kinase